MKAIRAKQRPTWSRDRHLVLAVIALLGPACSRSSDDLEGEALGSVAAHEHGVARLDLAVDGTVLTAEIEAPGMSVFGFEHEPVSEEDSVSIAWAVEAIEERFSEVLVLDPALGCAVSRATATLVEEDEHAADDGEHADTEVHSELKGSVVFLCDRDPTGSEAQIAFAELFPAIERVDLQVISSERQTGRRVRAQGTRFRL